MICNCMNCSCIALHRPDLVGSIFRCPNCGQYRNEHGIALQQGDIKNLRRANGFPDYDSGDQAKKYSTGKF